MRILFDTNVLLRAHPHSTGPARRVVRTAILLNDVLLSSKYMIEELGRVLNRPRVLRSFNMTPIFAMEYLRAVAEISSIVIPIAVPEGLLRDEADAPVLGTALAGRAEILCTGDTDFYEKRVLDYAAERGVRIITELDLLRSPDFLHRGR